MKNERSSRMNTFSTGQRIVSYILKTVVIVSAAVGTFLCVYSGRNSFMGGLNSFMYFTIQSNIAAAVICAIGLYLMISGRKIGSVWYIVKFVGTVSITLTGAVYCFVLAPTMDNPWNIDGILTHVVVPAASVIDFFVTVTSGTIKKRDTVWVTIPPLLYAIYAGIGYKLGWQFSEGHNYPYFFLNWGSPAGAFGFTDELPYMGCAWWILALLIALIAVGLLYLLAADLLKKLMKKA
ncbi:MAG: Pr6Pr family membrane protein [Oscillospiraceae bacterium]|nr:Pr6Pr family membrane protein [Oscillospiraceae bacterium]